MKRLLSFVLLAAAAGAHAQLVFGVDGAAGSNPGGSGAFYLDMTTDAVKQLWTGAQSQSRVTGMVSTGSALVGASGLREFRWAYGAIGTAPTQTDLFYRLGSDGVVYGTAFANLASNEGQIYGYTNFNTVGGARVEDGIYRIDSTQTVANVVNTTLVWRHGDLNYNFEGLAYNPVDNLFYATNNPGANATTTAGPGIFTIDAFGTGAVRKFMDYDPFVAGATGLTLGGGKLWISGKASASTELHIASIDLNARTYGDPYAILGFSTGNRKTSLVWAPGATSPVPEPASLAALGVGALALVRRRR